MSTEQTSAPAALLAMPMDVPLGRDQISRPTSPDSEPKRSPSAGSDSLDGQTRTDPHARCAVEGKSSQQATAGAAPIERAPAGTSATAAATEDANSIVDPLLPFKTNQAAQESVVAQVERGGLVDDFPGDHNDHDIPEMIVAGDQLPRAARPMTTPKGQSPLADQTPPLAMDPSTPNADPSGVEEAGSPTPAISGAIPNTPPPELADPLLALAADVLDDLESVRIANENRLRQLTRDEEDSDGEERGFGLTLDHPDVARLNALVGALADAEKSATKNLEKRLREHALYPWLKRQKGVGDKQAARLLASIGDPYKRPEMVRTDGAVEPARPRRVSELWAYAGYHVLPVGTQRGNDAHIAGGVDRASSFPAGHTSADAHGVYASGGKTGHPDHFVGDHHDRTVGVAPKRARGQRANWSSTAKMRAYLIAESTMKQLKRTCPAAEELGYATHADGCECSPYRKIYDAARQKYADSVHHAECIRCGPKGKPAPVGSDLSRKHKQARALRIVSKELLKDLWREARRIHLGEEATP